MGRTESPLEKCLNLLLELYNVQINEQSNSEDVPIMKKTVNRHYLDLSTHQQEIIIRLSDILKVDLGVPRYNI